MLNKADVLKRSRERQRAICLRTAKRQMQQNYERRRLDHSTAHSLPHKAVIASDPTANHTSQTNNNRWATRLHYQSWYHILCLNLCLLMLRTRISDDPKKAPISRAEMRHRTEKLYKSLPEVKERERLTKQNRTLHSNRIMLDSYKAVSSLFLPGIRKCY